MNTKTTKNLYGLGDYNTDQIKALAKIFELERQSPDIIYNRRPDATLNPGQYIKSMDLEEMQYIIPDAFAGKIGIELISNLNIKQLEEMGQESDAYQKQAIRNALRRTLEQEQLPSQAKTNLAHIQNYIRHSPAWQL